jgi:hypothetical protein
MQGFVFVHCLNDLTVFHQYSVWQLVPYFAMNAFLSGAFNRKAEWHSALQYLTASPQSRDRDGTDFRDFRDVLKRKSAKLAKDTEF